MSLRHDQEREVAGSSVWRRLPLAYSSCCKRSKMAGLPFLTDNLGDDLVIVLLAFALLSPEPLLTALAILFLHLSFWAVYEIGYYENDLVAERYEREGKVPAAFREFRGVFSQNVAWLWAAALGSIGICFAFASRGSPLMSRLDEQRPVVGQGRWMPEPEALVVALIFWLGFLVTMRGLYYAYNHIDKESRIYLYLPLQAMKYGFPVLFFPLGAAGAALVLAQVLRRWLPYIQYRLARIPKDRFPARLVRLIIFSLLWLLLLPAEHDSPSFYLMGAVAFLLLFIRSWRQIRERLAAVRHVSKDAWNTRAHRATVPVMIPVERRLRIPEPDPGDRGGAGD